MSEVTQPLPQRSLAGLGNSLLNVARHPRTIRAAGIGLPVVTIAAALIPLGWWLTVVGLTSEAMAALMIATLVLMGGHFGRHATDRILDADTWGGVASPILRGLGVAFLAGFSPFIVTVLVIAAEKLTEGWVEVAFVKGYGPPVLAIIVTVAITHWWCRWAVRWGSAATSFAPFGEETFSLTVTDHDEATLLRVARHEAAHALVAQSLGLDVERITTRPQGGHVGGLVRYRDTGAGVDTDLVWAKCVSAVAGHLVDLEHQRNDEGSSNDLGAALVHAMNLASIGLAPAGYDGPLTVAAIYDGAVERAREILAQERATLDQLTVRLIDHRTIEFGEVGEFGAWLARPDTES